MEEIIKRNKHGGHKILLQIGATSLSLPVPSHAKVRRKPCGYNLAQLYVKHLNQSHISLMHLDGLYLEEKCSDV